MSDYAPVLRTCGYCRGTGRRNEFDCLACKCAGLVWVPVPHAGYPDDDWLSSEEDGRRENDRPEPD